MPFVISESSRDRICQRYQWISVRFITIHFLHLFYMVCMQSLGIGKEWRKEKAINREHNLYRRPWIRCKALKAQLPFNLAHLGALRFIWLVQMLERVFCLKHAPSSIDKHCKLLTIVWKFIFMCTFTESRQIILLITFMLHFPLMLILQSNIPYEIALQMRSNPIKDLLSR